MGNTANDISDAIRARSLDIGWMKPLMRAGWVAKGAVYVLMGLIAIPIAVGSGGSEGDQATRRGALAEIAEASYGAVLLVLVSVGLLLYSGWRLTSAMLPGDDGEAETWAHRIGWLFSAVVYLFLAWSALSVVLSDGGGSGSTGQSGSGGQSTVEELSRSLLESAGGRWLLGLGALGGLAVAGYFGYKGIERKYLEEIDVSSASSWERTVLTEFGRVGWVGRGITVALISVFVLIAAVTADPDEAKGLDGALRDVSDNWWGAILVIVAGIGLAAYGVHAAVSARHRRLLGP